MGSDGRTGGGVPGRGAISARSGVPDARSGVPDARSGVSDARAARARELHRLAAETEALASRQRAERDRLIRQLRAEDPRRWSYGALASALGCSRELIALVVKRKDA